MTRALLALIVSLLPVLAQARILVISDIDDTLKISHVRDRVDMILSAAETTRSFVGMPELFQTLNRRGDVDFAYVSAAPAVIMAAAHRAFLRQNGFPEGDLTLRDLGEAKQSFKRRVLEVLVARYRPDTVLLFGDNGELDPVIYRAFIQSRAGLPLVARSWLHLLYPTDTAAVSYGTILRPYATAIEIAVDLGQFGLIDPRDVRDIVARVGAGLRQDQENERRGPQVFPSWMRCHPAVLKMPRALPAGWRAVLKACER